MKKIKLFETGAGMIHLVGNENIPTKDGFILEDNFIEIDNNNQILNYGKVKAIEDEYGIINLDEFIKKSIPIYAFIENNSKIYFIYYFEYMVFLNGLVGFRDNKIFFDNLKIGILTQDLKAYEILENGEFKFLGYPFIIKNKVPEKYFSENKLYIANYYLKNKKKFIEIESITNKNIII